MTLAEVSHTTLGIRALEAYPANPERGRFQPDDQHDAALEGLTNLAFPG